MRQRRAISRSLFWLTALECGSSSRVPACRVFSSVRPLSPSSPVGRAGTPPFRSSSVPNSRSPSRSRPQARNGCTRSNWTATGWPHASIMAACSFSRGPASTGRRNIQTQLLRWRTCRQDGLSRRRTLRRRRCRIAELRAYAGRDRWRARRAPGLLRFRSLAHRRMGRLELVAS
jgi:hypothetical protein